MPSTRALLLIAVLGTTCRSVPYQDQTGDHRYLPTERAYRYGDAPQEIRTLPQRGIDAPSANTGETSTKVAEIIKQITDVIKNAEGNTDRARMGKIRPPKRSKSKAPSAPQHTGNAQIGKIQSSTQGRSNPLPTPQRADKAQIGTIQSSTQGRSTAPSGELRQGDTRCPPLERVYTYPDVPQGTQQDLASITRTLQQLRRKAPRAADSETYSKVQDVIQNVFAVMKYVRDNADSAKISKTPTSRQDQSHPHSGPQHTGYAQISNTHTSTQHQSHPHSVPQHTCYAQISNTPTSTQHQYHPHSVPQHTSYAQFSAIQSSTQGQSNVPSAPQQPGNAQFSAMQSSTQRQSNVPSAPQQSGNTQISSMQSSTQRQSNVPSAPQQSGNAQISTMQSSTQGQSNVPSAPQQSGNAQFSAMQSSTQGQSNVSSAPQQFGNAQFSAIQSSTRQPTDVSSSNAPKLPFESSSNAVPLYLLSDLDLSHQYPKGSALAGALLKHNGHITLVPMLFQPASCTVLRPQFLH